MEASDDLAPRSSSEEAHEGTGPDTWISLAAAFLGEARIIALREGSGTWHSSARLTESQKRDLETALVQGELGGTGEVRFGREGLWVLDIFPFDESGVMGRLGRLFILASEPTPLSPGERQGLQRLVAQLGRFRSVRAGEERRSLDRGPLGASFVPGLAHELRNFIFGISASLDALEVRFRGIEGGEKYQAVIRKSLDRLGVFVDELREYGDPARRAWAEFPLEPILREACEHHKVRAERPGVGLAIRFDGDLPRIRGDEQGLRLAFIHLLDLALQGSHGGTIPIDLRVQAGGAGVRAEIQGGLEVALNQGDLDPSRLFEPFYFRPSGMGRLALPVARRIFEAHGGALVAEARREGGVAIRFTLPTI